MSNIPSLKGAIACADCGATIFLKAEGATGYACTSVPRLPSRLWRYLRTDYTSHTSPTETPQFPGFPAHYDVEGEAEAYKAEQTLPERRICYACAAVLERETMVATGRCCLYLVEKETEQRLGTVDRTYSRRTMGGVVHYRYELSNWTGNAPFRFLGSVRESTGYGFGRSYPVRTFRFLGPDGFVWSGRNAGDMQLARCKRTKERFQKV